MLNPLSDAALFDPGPASPPLTIPGSVDPADRRRLQRLIRNAARYVPCYERIWSQAGVDLDALPEDQALANIPIVTKSDLLRFSAEQRVDRRELIQHLIREVTSGSSGQPFDFRMNRATVARRRSRLMRGLWAAGYRPGRKLMRISHQPAPTTNLLLHCMALIGWHYADLYQDEGSLEEEYLGFRPNVLYAPLSPLVAVAQRLQSSGRHCEHRPQVVISTAEQVTDSYRRLLRSAYGVDATDFYAMTEFGLIAWRSPGSGAYVVPKGEYLLEFVPSTTHVGYDRLIVTDLHATAMPMIRFDTGDLVRRDQGHPDRPIVEFVGRQIDFIVLPNGKRISPYAIDAQLDEVPGLDQFRVVQHADLRVDVFVRTSALTATQVHEEVTRALSTLCDGLLKIQLHEWRDPRTSNAQKLRTIQSHARLA